MSSGEFRSVGSDLRNVQHQLGDLSRQIRDHAKTTAATDVDRARLEGEMATQVNIIAKEVQTLRKWAADHMKGHSLMDTGPQTPKLAIVSAAKEDSERASAEEARASAAEKHSRAALWSKIVLVIGAGGIGAAIRAVMS